jgi:hypothetical protein
MFTTVHAGAAAPPHAPLRRGVAAGSRARRLCCRRTPPQRAPCCIIISSGGDAHRGPVQHDRGVFLTQNATPISTAVVPVVAFVQGVRRARDARAMRSVCADEIAKIASGFSLACDERARVSSTTHCARIRSVCWLTRSRALTCTPRYTQTQARNHHTEVAAMMQTVQQLDLLSHCGFEVWRVFQFARTDVGYGCHVGALKPLELKSAHVQFSGKNGRGAVRAQLDLTGKRAAAKIRAGCDILGTVMGTDAAGQSFIISFLHFSGEADAAALEQLYGDGRILVNFKPSKTQRYKFIMQQHSFDPQRADDMDRLRSRLRDAHDAAHDAVGSLALQPLWALNYNEGEYSNSVSHYPEAHAYDGRAAASARQRRQPGRACSPGRQGGLPAAPGVRRVAAAASEDDELGQDPAALDCEIGLLLGHGH